MTFAKKKVTKNHAGNVEHFGVRYEFGDVIGCAIDVKEQTISKRSFSTFMCSKFSRGLNFIAF